MKEMNIKKILNGSSSLNDVKKMTGTRRATLVNRVVHVNFTTGVPEAELILAVIKQAIRDLGSLLDWRLLKEQKRDCPNSLQPDPELVLMSRNLDHVMTLIGIDPDYIYDLLHSVELIKRKPGPNGVFIYGELKDEIGA